MCYLYISSEVYHFSHERELFDTIVSGREEKKGWLTWSRAGSCALKQMCAFDVGMSWAEINQVRQRECGTGTIPANLSH